MIIFYHNYFYIYGYFFKYVFKETICIKIYKIPSFYFHVIKIMIIYVKQ